MDKVTQQNAVGAEEGALISEKLNAHASQMKRIIGAMTTLVNGRANGAGENSGKINEHCQMVDTSNAHALLPGAKSPASKTKESGPELLTSINDEDLKDF